MGKRPVQRCECCCEKKDFEYTAHCSLVSGYKARLRYSIAILISCPVRKWQIFGGDCGAEGGRRRKGGKIAVLLLGAL